MAIASKKTSKPTLLDMGDSILGHNPIGDDITDTDNSISTSRIVDIDSRIINQVAYIEKGNWTVSYYGQVKKEDDLTTNVDILNTIVGNNYYCVNELNIKVTTPMSDGSENVSFSAVLPASIYPLIGDIIVAKTISGMLGMFRISGKNLNTYVENPVYTVEAKLDRLVRDDPQVFEQLKNKVIRNYTNLGNNVFVKESEYTKYKEIAESYFDIKDHYNTNFNLMKDSELVYDPMTQALYNAVTSNYVKLPNYVSTRFLKGTLYDGIINRKPLSFITKRDYEIGLSPTDNSRMHFRFKNALINNTKVINPIQSNRATHQHTTYEDELNTQPTPPVTNKYNKDFRLQSVPTVVGTPIVAVIDTTTITYIDNGSTRIEIRERILTADDKPVLDNIANVGDTERITITQTFDFEIKDNIKTDRLKLVKQEIETKYIDLQGNQNITIRETDISMKDFDKTVCLSPVVAHITKLTKDVVITQIPHIDNPTPVSNVTGNITVTTWDYGNQRKEVTDSPTRTITRLQNLELWGNRLGVVSEVIDTAYKDGITQSTHVEYLNEDAYVRLPIVLQVVPPIPEVVPLQVESIDVIRTSTILGNDSSEYKEVITTHLVNPIDATKNEVHVETRTQQVDTTTNPYTVITETLRTVITYSDGVTDSTDVTVNVNPVSDLLYTDASIVSNIVNGVTITTYETPYTRKEVKVDVSSGNKVTSTRLQIKDVNTGTFTKETVTIEEQDSTGIIVSKTIKVITSNITPIVLQIPTPHVPVIVQITPIPNPTPVTNAVGNTVITTINNGNQRTEIVYYGTHTVTRVQDLVLSDNVLTVTHETVTTVYNDGVTQTTVTVTPLPVAPITLQVRTIIQPIIEHLNPTISRPIVPFYYNSPLGEEVGYVPNGFVGVPPVVNSTPEPVLPLAVTRHPLLPQHEAGDTTYLVSSKFYDLVTDTLFEKALMQCLSSETITNVEALLNIYMDLTKTEQYTYGPYILAIAKCWAYSTLKMDLT